MSWLFGGPSKVQPAPVDPMVINKLLGDDNIFVIMNDFNVPSEFQEQLKKSILENYRRQTQSEQYPLVIIQYNYKNPCLFTHIRNNLQKFGTTIQNLKSNNQPQEIIDYTKKSQLDSVADLILHADWKGLIGPANLIKDESGNPIGINPNLLDRFGPQCNEFVQSNGNVKLESQPYVPPAPARTPAHTGYDPRFRGMGRRKTIRKNKKHSTKKHRKVKVTHRK